MVLNDDPGRLMLRRGFLFDNHPSGNVQPSESDLTITRKIKESVNVMDIHLPDHLIMVLEGKHYRRADEGII